MKSISVKINDSTQTIAQAKVITKDGQPTVIKATRNANYELINDATGHAPDHIVTKRVGKDLHISFEDDAKESDLIIKDFYDYDKSALIGQAESGQYHYYIPDTGLTQDYVTELVIGDIEGQALGGQGYPAPWWIGAEEGSRFGVMPWLVGIAGLAGIAAASGGNDKGGSGNNNNTTFKPQTGTDDITITVAGDGMVNKDEADKDTVPVTVKVTPKNGETVTDVKVTVNGKDHPATKGTDGSYTAQVPSADIKEDTAKTATAKVSLTKDGKTGTVTDKETYTVDTDAPTVNATRQPDNSVTGTTEPNTTITDKDGKPITDANGKPIVSDDKGKFTIPADKVPADNTIGAKDKAGNVGTGNVKPKDTTFKPQTGTDDITITVAGDGMVNKDEADKDTVPVTVKVTPKNGETVTDVKVTVNGKEHTATKQANGDYVAQVKPDDIKADKDKTATAKVSLTKDGKTGTVTDKETYTVDTDAPTVNATRQPDNSVTGTTEPNTTITDKDGKPITDANGKPIVSDDKGKFTIPADKVPADNTIGAKDKAGNVGTGNVKPKDTTFKPQTGTDDITITVAGDGMVNKDEADKDTVPVTVKVTPKNGETVTDVKVTVNGKEHTATKQANGDYVAQVKPDDIKADKDKTATAKVSLTKDGKTGTVTDKETYTVDTDAPTVNATRQPDNSVTGTTEPNTTITDKDGKPITDANGKPIVSDDKGKFTIPADKVPADNTIGAKDKAGNVGTGNVKPKDTTFKPQTGTDDITITVAGDGMVNKDEADKDTVPVTVKVTPKNGETVTDVKVTVNGKEHTATKQANGDYVAQVKPDDIKADKDKTATAKVSLTKDGKTGTVTDKETYTVDTDAPTVNATRQPDNSVTGTTEPNTTITDKDGKPITDANGKPIVSDDKGKFTIPADKVPADNTIGAKDKAGNVGTGNVKPKDTTFKPQTGTDDITITVAGDGMVNKDEADKDTVPVTVKVTPKNGETVTDVKVTVNGKEHTATKQANGDYVAQVKPDDIKADKDKTATAKVSLTKDGKTGTVTDKETYTVDTDAPTVNATRQPDNSVTGTTEPNTTITDKDGKPITDANGKPIVSDDKGKFTIPADKVPADNTIGAKDKAGNVGTGNVKPKDTTFKPQTGTDDITITVAGDGMVNKDEADKDTVPVTVKVTPKNGETVTDVKVTVNGKEHTATKQANGDYVAQVKPDDIKADKDKTATAKVSLTKDGKTGTVTDKETYTVDTDAPTVNATRQPDNSVTGTTEPNTTITDKDGKPITDANGKPIVSDDKGKFTIPADKVPADNTIGAKDKAGNVGTGNVKPKDTTFKPQTGTDDITITVAGDGMVNKDEADKDTVPVTVKVTPKNGETVTDVKVTVNGKEHTATKQANGDYVAQVKPDDIKADKDKTATAKVSLTKDGKTGTVTDKETYTVDTDAPTVNATRQPDNSVTGTTEPNTTITDKDGKPITDANGKPIVSDDKGKFTIPADKVPADNTIGAKDKAGNVGTGNVKPKDTTFKPQTGTDDITITVAGDGMVNKDEADKDTVPVTVKVTPKNGETVTDVKVTVNGKEHTATKQANGDYVAQVKPDDIKADKDKTATAKVSLTKDGKTGTVTDKETYTVDTDAPTVNATRQPDNSVTGTTEPNTTITDKDGKPITDANGKPIVSDDKGKFTIPADKVPADNTIGAKDKAGNVGTGNVKPKDTTFKPQTGTDDITITVAGDGMVNKDEADKDTVPVTVKVTPKNGETVTDVKVTVNGKEHTATKQANGDYVAQVKPDDIKADKDKTATAKVSLTKDGKTGTVTDKETYTVDTDAPAKPATPDMTAQTDTGVSSEDNNTKNNKPSFTVETPADGETPVLMVDGKPVEAEVTKNNGATTLTPKQPIPDGDHKVSVVVTDSAGNTSEPSEALPIVIDTQAPNAPNAAVSGNGTKVIGTTEPNATVTIKDKDGKPIGKGTADDEGNYTVDLESPLTNGEKVQAVATDKSGNESAPTPTTAPVVSSSKFVISTKQTEVTEGGTVTFKVTRTDGTDKGSSVNWALTGSTNKPAATVTGQDSDFANDQPTSGTLTFAPGETEKTIEVKIKDDKVVEKTESFTVTLSGAKGATITTDSASSVIKNNDKLVVGLAKDSYSDTPQVGSDNDQYTNNPKVIVSNIPNGAKWEYRLNNGEWKDGNNPNNEGKATFDLKPAPGVWQGVSYKIEARVKSNQDYDSNSTLGSLDMTLDQSVRAPIITGVESGNQITGIAEANSFVYIDKDNSGSYSKGDVGTYADDKGKFTLPFGEKLAETGKDALIFGNQGKDVPLARLGVIDEAGNTLAKNEMSNFFYFDDLDGRDYFSTATSKTGSTVASITNLQDIPHTVYVNNVISAGTFNFGSADDVLVQNGGYLRNNTHINMGDGNDYAKFNYISQAGVGSLDMGSGNDILVVGISNGVSIRGSTVKLGAGDDIVRSGKVDGINGFLDSGEGYDLWEVTGTGIRQNLDHISGMEVIDLGGGKNRLDVKLADVIKNADEATVIGDRSYKGLFIKGTSQDTVDLGNNGKGSLGKFVQDSSKAPEGYDAYWDGSNENTLIFIQQGINVI